MSSTTTDRRLGLTGSAAIKVPCKAATTSNITLSAAQTIDGVSCVAGDRVLVKSQTSSVDNGIYVVDTGTWTRDLDFDGVADVVTGTIVMVLNGSTNANTYWRLATTGTATFGTSAITFAAALAGDSAMVTFLPSGTGAVASDLQSYLRLLKYVQGWIPTTLWAGIAARTNVTDLTTYIQAAMDAIGVAGGGKLIFPLGDYLCTTHTTVGGNAWNLIAKYDNVELHLEGGAVLKNNDDATLLGIGGFFKPSTLANWANYSVRESANYGVTFTLYAISAASKYANSVTLSTPAQNTNFAVGNWILIRTGQTTTTGTGQPLGEFNKITAINAGTGQLTLEYPLRNSYASENYPVGHVSAGNPVPWGIINCTSPTNVLLENFRLTGTGRLENTSACTKQLINGNQTIGRVVEGVELVSYADVMSEGSTLARHINTKIRYLGTGTPLAYSQDSCNHDSIFADSIISGIGQPYIHMHEGCSGQISGITMVCRTPVAANVSISIRQRAHDVVVNNVRIFGFGADSASAGVYSDATTDRITVDNIHAVGAVSAIAPAVNLIGTNSYCGRVTTDTGVTIAPDLGNQLLGDLTQFFSAGLMFLQQGTPVRSLVNSGGSDGWLLDDSSTEGITFGVQLPDIWQKAQLRLWYVNVTANAGNVRFLTGWNITGTGDTVTIIGDGNNVFTDTAGAQNVIKVTALAVNTINGLAPSKMMNFVVQRVGGDAADTLTGDIALLGVELVRTF